MKIIFIIIVIIVGILSIIIALVLWRLTNPVGKVQKLQDVNCIPIQQERLYADVKSLTSIRPYRNEKSAEGMQKSVDFIQKSFKEAGYNTELQSFQTPNGKTYQNIIAFYGDITKPRLVVGAHYDVCGEQDGADDNASAVAGMLEIARLL